MHLGAGTEHAHSVVVDMGVGVVVVGGFLLLLLKDVLPRCIAKWYVMRACRLHCASCMYGSSCPQRCMGSELGLAVFLLVSASNCLPQPLVHPAAGLQLPADCCIAQPAAHPSSY